MITQDGGSHDHRPRHSGHCEPTVAFSGLAARPDNKFHMKKKKEKKNTFYIPQIFMHISQYTFIIILINTKKKNNTVIPKENNGY